MLVILLILVSGLLCSNLYLLNENKQIKNDIKDQAVMICKLMYHVSKDIEDYETTAKLHKRLGKKINFNKLCE